MSTTVDFAVLLGMVALVVILMVGLVLAVTTVYMHFFDRTPKQEEIDEWLRDTDNG